MVYNVRAYMEFRVVDSLILHLNFTPRSLYPQENLVSLKFILGLLERNLFWPLPGLERHIMQLVE
jgi:hypothetical protein